MHVVLKRNDGVLRMSKKNRYLLYIYIIYLLLLLLLLLKYKELIDISDTSLKDQIVSSKKTTYFRHTLCRLST